MSYVRLCREEEIREGEVRAFPTKYGTVALAKIKGKICAFQDACSHDDGPLSGGKLEGDEIECPRHGARFHLCSGRVLQMPATEDLEVYPVRIHEGYLEVELD